MELVRLQQRVYNVLSEERRRKRKGVKPISQVKVNQKFQSSPSLSLQELVAPWLC